MPTGATGQIILKLYVSLNATSREILLPADRKRPLFFTRHTCTHYISPFSFFKSAIEKIIVQIVLVDFIRYRDVHA